MNSFLKYFQKLFVFYVKTRRSKIKKIMGRNLIVGNIHSQFSKLMAVLDNAGFNPEEDILYSVGDFCDRGSEAVRTLRFLIGLRNFKAVICNHDILL